MISINIISRSDRVYYCKEFYFQELCFYIKFYTCNESFSKNILEIKIPHCIVHVSISVEQIRRDLMIIQ